MLTTVGAEELRDQVRSFLARHDPAVTGRLDFLRARFDAGLAWVRYPAGLGGQGLSRALQPVVDAEFAAAGAPTNRPERIGIGLGMAAPTILAFGSDGTAAALAAAAVDRRGNLVPAIQRAGRGLGPGRPGHPGGAQPGRRQLAGQRPESLDVLGARGQAGAAGGPERPRPAEAPGLTYFSVDMTAPGVEVRPLRQLTGEAEFNEVFLTDVAIADSDRIGAVGEGWKVATGTLMNERVAIGGAALPREGGMISSAVRAWRDRPELRTPGLHDTMLRLWAAAEVARLAGERLRQQLAAGRPGPEGSAAKLVFARLNQEITGFELELAGADGLRYGDWTMHRPETANFFGRDVGYRYLRARGNSIERGTSEILRNIIAERVLGLPAEVRLDTGVPWKDLPR